VNSETLYVVYDEMRQPVTKALQDAYEQFGATKELQKFLPTQQVNICPNCQRSHEAMEFFYATLLRSIDLMITESEDFKKFLAERGYATNES